MKLSIPAFQDKAAGDTIYDVSDEEDDDIQVLNEVIPAIYGPDIDVVFSRLHSHKGSSKKIFF